MKKILNVILLVDSASVPDISNLEGPFQEADPPELHVVKALHLLGHRYEVVDIFDQVEPVVNKIKQLSPDVIFNMTEQFRNNRWLDKDIAGLLELLDFPFTGAGSTGLMLAGNKSICKQVLSTRRIRVPGHIVIQPGRKARLPRGMHYPLVVKPLGLDGSEGISNSSLVRNYEELTSRAEMIHQHFLQPAIAEEYIEGREMYVTVIGNKKLKVLPPREIHFNDEDGKGPVMATSRVKWNEKYRNKWNIKFGFARIDEKTSVRIARVCRKTYRLMHMQDYCRIDIRITPDGRIVVLEVNPNPNIAYKDEVAESAEKAGMKYPELINCILQLAIKRHQTYYRD